MITSEQFSKIFPKAQDPQEWTDSLNQFIPLYDIQNVNAFLAQCGHESQGFCRTLENLNYSAAGLIATWPTRFNDSNAPKYARQPEKIANKVYADRLGNGPESSGDGWRYRGAGIIQLTGKANHSAFAKAIGKTLEEATKYLHTIQGAVESGCWFWQTKKLNQYGDDMNLLTRRINGGLIGLTERKNLLEEVKEVLA
ncbi:MAG: glycoside hydrolase family 19 protein [Desulfobulbaceae bacterium]|nr:glycoside hydrolase family 19 protein [Desulfobulbaceae bacterium]